MMRVTKAVVSRSFRLFQPVGPVPRRHLYMQFKLAPLPGENKVEASRRVQAQVLSELSKHRKSLVFLASETRLSLPEETLANAAKRHGAATLSQVGLGYAETRLFPGHCAMGYIDETGALPQKYTFSLRPDPLRAPLYRAPTAPDPRLPAALTAAPTLVRPAMHSSLEQEIGLWAKDAFYASYVHPGREAYSLHCLLKPLSFFEQARYFKAVTELKATSQRYSLLDHYHEEKLVASENCTQVCRLLEWMSPRNFNLKKTLGDNPTPQWVAQVLGKQFLQDKSAAAARERIALEKARDELSLPFRRT